MNFIDKLVNTISPEAGLRRERARITANQLRAYDAAQNGRRLKNWKAPSTSQAGESAPSLVTLRNRARDLGRNNPYAKRAIEILSSNVIGVGIQPSFIGGRGTNRVKQAFGTWAYSTDCDFNKYTNFYGLQRNIASAMFRDGEVLVRRYRRNNGLNSIPIALQVLEADFLDHNKNAQLQGGGRIIQGVEFDAKGQRVAYWIFNTHPGDTYSPGGFQSFRADASEIIHLFESLRPGQVRGVPYGVSSFVRMRDLDLYADAQLVRQQIAACWVAFVQDSSEMHTGGAPSSYEGASRFEPGAIEELPPGKTITFGTPPKADGYESYTRTVLREIACAYGVTYEALTGDMSQVNFSSARMNFIEFGRLVENLQEHVFVPTLLNGVWGWINEACKVAGLTRNDITVNWTAPRRQAVDPLKEVTALKEMVRAGLISPSEAIRQGGYIPEEVFAEIAADYKKFDEFKFMFTVDPRNDASRGEYFPIPNKESPDVFKEDANGFSE